MVPVRLPFLLSVDMKSGMKGRVLPWAEAVPFMEVLLTPERSGREGRLGLEPPSSAVGGALLLGR